MTEDKVDNLIPEDLGCRELFKNNFKVALAKKCKDDYDARKANEIESPLLADNETVQDSVSNNDETVKDSVSNNDDSIVSLNESHTDENKESNGSISNEAQACTSVVNKFKQFPNSYTDCNYCFTYILNHLTNKLLINICLTLYPW